MFTFDLYTFIIISWTVKQLHKSRCQEAVSVLYLKSY